jgi:hypothetical protein
VHLAIRRYRKGVMIRKYLRFLDLIEADEVSLLVEPADKPAKAQPEELKAGFRQHRIDAQFPAIEYSIARSDIARNDLMGPARQRRCDFKLQRLCSLYST